MSSDELVDRAEKHLAADHARDEILDQAQRFAEVLRDDTDPARRAVGDELIEIVGVPS